MIVKNVYAEKLDNFGRGIVYQNGKITFVKNLLPCEKADIEIVLDKKRYALGKVVRLLEKSSDRVDPKCPYENCGCMLKHLDYLKQLEYKESKVKDIIYKFSGMVPKFNPIVYEDCWNYRNKITLKISNGTCYCKPGTNNMIKIDSCFLVSDKVNEIIKVLNTLDLSKAQEVVIKEFNGIMLIIDGYLDISLLKTLVNSIYLNGKLVYGAEYITTLIKDLTFYISKDSFFQVNKYLTENLYDVAIEYCGNDKSKKVLDLYCGTGTISLLLSKYFKEVIGIEINKEAIKCANLNKKANNIDNVSFVCGDASKKIDDLKADIVVVDPPRSGLTNKGIKDIIKINPEKIVYVSCDLVTLARDLGILKEKYNVLEITPVDMFPNTYHVETVTLLERK